MPDMNENSETQQEYFGRANASRMSVEEREKTILLQQLSDREKRIVELEMTVGTLRTFSNEQATCIERFEKENKVLAQNLEDTEILNKTYEKRFDDLEKENAELKKLKRECETSLCRAEFQYNYEQLTKAKDLLKQWLQTSKASGCDNINIVTDTEQFLNSEVEK